ncbi:hypothetical protein [Alicyclobacillus suci]|uniref:hypothetical protein n=1 Tax=Alicyclobacillus suci TaxID=2816080 RepID=UPI001A8DBC72|nr:hypothetical protein [Alicyclobacillus suci]
MSDVHGRITGCLHRLQDAYDELQHPNTDIAFRLQRLQEFISTDVPAVIAELEECQAALDRQGVRRVVRTRTVGHLSRVL